MQPLYRRHFYVPATYFLAALLCAEASAIGFRLGSLWTVLAALFCIVNFAITGLLFGCCFRFHHPMQAACETTIRLCKRFPAVFRNMIAGLKLELAICQFDRGNLEKAEELYRDAEKALKGNPYWYCIEGLYHQSRADIHKREGKLAESEAAGDKVGFAVLCFRALWICGMGLAGLVALFLCSELTELDVSTTPIVLLTVAVLVLIFGLLALVGGALVPLSLLAELVLTIVKKLQPGWQKPARKTLLGLLMIIPVVTLAFVGLLLFSFIYWNPDAGYGALLQMNPQIAIEKYSEGIRKNPTDSRAYTARAYAYNSQGKYQEAIDDYSRSIELNPKYVWAYIDRGYAYSCLGRYEEAINAYSEAIEVNPNCSAAYAGRGYVFNSKKQYDRAIDDCSRAIELRPGNAEAYAQRSYAYKMLGKTDLSESDTRKASELGYRQPGPSAMQ